MKIPAHTLLVLTPGRGSQAAPVPAPLPRAPFNTVLFLSVVSGVVGGGPVTCQRTLHRSPLAGMLSFSIFSGSRELSPFLEPDLTHPGSPVLGLAAGTLLLQLPACTWQRARTPPQGGGVGCGLPCLCLLDELWSSPGGQRATAGKLCASFTRSQLAGVPGLGLNKASELSAAAFPHLKRSQSRREGAGSRER